MKRGEIEKSGEGPAKKQENLGEKLMRVGKRGGHTTPTAPFWRPKELKLLAPAAAPHNTGGSGEVQEKRLNNYIEDNFFQPPSVSARKLAATLWELHQYKLPLDKMHHPRLRRVNHQHQHQHQHQYQYQHHHHQQLYKDKGGLEPPDPSPDLPELPGSSCSLRRHVAATLMQHHRSIERNNHALQPVSPASFGSSMEIAPYNPAVTPTSSIELKGRTGETSYSLKTSTELLKVLNRIWSLEEQHISNISLIKALKKELDHARLRIKELMRDQQSDRLEIDELMKQITEDKLVRKNKEQDRINATIQSIRAELEDERKLRKRSESLHRKLARELFDLKTTLASISKDLEKERKSRNLLEDLCDEFAWGIRDYEKELHAHRQKSDKDWNERGDHDQLILHISESWLDERGQLKLKTGHGLAEKKSAVDKLSSEIEALIQTKRNGNPKINCNEVSMDPILRRSSLESIPLNVAVSAPRDEDDDEDDDSTGSDSNCFELGKTSESNLKPQENEYQKNQYDEALKTKKTLGVSDRATGPSPSSLQVKFEEQIAHAMTHGEKINHVENAERFKVGQENSVEAAKQSSSERKYESEGITGLNSNYMIDNLIRNHYLLSESGNMLPDKDHRVASSSVWRSHPSPVRQWTEKLPSHDLNIPESSSNLPPDLKENTLKAKLFEARIRGQRSRSRLKASIIPSISK